MDCQDDLPLEAFYVRAPVGTLRGKAYAKRHRAERLEYGRKWSAERPEYMRAAARKSYQKHRERKQREARERYQANPEKGREQRLKTLYKHAYGLTTPAYQELVERHPGVCAICSRPERRKIRGRVTRLSIDHCHKSGRVRGLVCSSCNTLIAMVEATADAIGFDETVKRLRVYLSME